MSAADRPRRRVYPGLDQLVLRGLVVVGTLTAVVAAQSAGARPGALLQWSLVALSLGTAARPESRVGTVLLLLMAYTWLLAPPDRSPLVLVAAGGMLLTHLSALLASQGPSRMPVDRAQVVRWAGRSLWLGLATAGVWALGLLATGLPGHPVVYGVGLVVLTGLALGAARWVDVRRTVA